MGAAAATSATTASRRCREPADMWLVEAVDGVWVVGGDIGAARPWAATSGAVRSAVGCSALVPIRGGFCGPAFEQLARGFFWKIGMARRGRCGRAFL